MNRIIPPMLHDLPETAAEFYLALRSNPHVEVENYFDLYSQLYQGMDEDKFWSDLDLVVQTPDIDEKNGVISVRSWESGFCEIDTYNFNRLSTRAKCVYFYACDKLTYNYFVQFDLKAMVKTLAYADLLDLINEVNEVMKRVIVIDTDQQIIASSVPLLAKFRSGDGLDAFRETVQDVTSWKAFSLWRSLARDNQWKFFLTSRIKSLNARAKKVGNNKDMKMIEAYLNKLIGYEKGTKVKRNSNESSTKFFNSLKINTLTDTKYKDKNKEKKTSRGELFSTSEEKQISPLEAEKIVASGVPAAAGQIEDFVSHLDRDEIKDILDYNNRTESVDEAIEYVIAAWNRKPVFRLLPKPSSEKVWERHTEEKNYQRFIYRVTAWMMAVIRNMEKMPSQDDIDKFMDRIEKGWVSKDGKVYGDESDAARKYDRKLVEKLISENSYVDLCDLAEKVISFGKTKKSSEGVLSLSDILKYV